jgi:hypothetical protein
MQFTGRWLSIFVLSIRERRWTTAVVLALMVGAYYIFFGSFFSLAFVFTFSGLVGSIASWWMGLSVGLIAGWQFGSKFKEQDSVSSGTAPDSSEQTAAVPRGNSLWSFASFRKNLVAGLVFGWFAGWWFFSVTNSIRCSPFVPESWFFNQWNDPLSFIVFLGAWSVVTLFFVVGVLKST